MPNRVKSATLALLLSAALPTQASAQIELGIDVSSIGVESWSFEGGPTRTITQMSVESPPASLRTFRVGFFVSDKVSVEPKISLDYSKYEGSDSNSDLTLSLGVLYHFTPERQRSQGYIRPVGSIIYADDHYGSRSQVSLGIGLGVKLPIMGQLAARLEAQYAHRFRNDDFATVNSLTAVFGFSFFTR